MCIKYLFRKEKKLKLTILALKKSNTVHFISVFFLKSGKVFFRNVPFSRFLRFLMKSLDTFGTRARIEEVRNMFGH